MKKQAIKPESAVRILLILLLALTLVYSAGCKESRDIGGSVTGRSVRIPSGEGVPFIRVLLNGPEDTRIHVTDSNGSYTMLNVPVGSYTLSFAWMGVLLYTQDLVVDQDETPYVVNMPQVGPGLNVLSGEVSGNTGSIPGAEVWVLYDGGGIAHVQADQNGEYIISDIEDGQVTVIARAPSHVDTTIPDITLGFEGTRNLDIEMEIISPSIEYGAVTGFVRNAEGEILNDAYVGIFENDVVPSIYMIAVGEALSGPAGYYLDIPEGTYTMICTRSGYQMESELVIVEADGIAEIDMILTSED